MLAYKEKRNLRYDKINEKRLAKNAAKNEKRVAKGKTAKLPKLKNKEKPTFRESILEAGEAPVILDPSLTKITVNQIQQYVFSNGYFDSKVQDSVVLDKKHKRAKVYYNISKSTPYTIQSITYKIEDPLLEPFIYNDTTASLIKRGAVFNESILQKERGRITNNQLNNGFFFFASDYIKYLVDTNLTGNNVHLTLIISKYSESFSGSNDSLVYINHPRFHLQNVYVILETIPDFRGKASDIYMKDTTLYNDITFLLPLSPRIATLQRLASTRLCVRGEYRECKCNRKLLRYGSWNGNRRVIRRRRYLG